MPPPGFEPGFPAPQAGVLSKLYYEGNKNKANLLFLKIENCFTYSFK